MTPKWLNRRQIITTSAALITAGSLGHFSSAHAKRAQGQKSLQRLQQGDLVGLVNTASTANMASLDYARSNISALGFRIKEGKHLLDRYGYLAGADRARAADLNAMFADSQVKAIFAMRGGWGSARMLRYLDWDVIRANPKLLIGYSDVTALHLAIAAKAGFPSIHGPNAANGWDGKPMESFRSMAMEGETPSFAPLKPEEWQLNRDYRPFSMIAPGKARGKIIGGNLTVLSALVGTKWMPETKGAVLFLEDIGEEEYRIDRMLTQLREAGILSQISGFVFGQCRRCSNGDTDYRGFNLPSVLQQHIARLNIPAFIGGHFGHVAGQYCLPMGTEVELNAGAGTIKMLKPLVI